MKGCEADIRRLLLRVDESPFKGNGKLLRLPSLAFRPLGAPFLKPESLVSAASLTALLTGRLQCI
jgi:hypothetical protein